MRTKANWKGLSSSLLHSIPAKYIEPLQNSITKTTASSQTATTAEGKKQTHLFVELTDLEGIGIRIYVNSIKN